MSATTKAPAGALAKSVIQNENILKITSQIPTAVQILELSSLPYATGLRQ